MRAAGGGGVPPGAWRGEEEAVQVRHGRVRAVRRYLSHLVPTSAFRPQQHSGSVARPPYTATKTFDLY